MASFNRVILVGNITRDIELKYTESGKAVTELGLAVNEKHKNAKDEWVEDVVFVDATMWGRTAEVCAEYLTKGSPVLIEGRLKLDRWQDSKTGDNRQKLKVVGDRMQMLGGSKEQGQGLSAGKVIADARGGSPALVPLVEKDEIPF